MRLIRIRDRQGNDVEVINLDDLLPGAFSEHKNKFVIIREDQTHFVVMTDHDSAMLDSTDIYTESAVEEFLADD